MGSKSSRRSISVRAATYQRLRAYCEDRKISMSGFLEKQIDEALDRARIEDIAERARRSEQPANGRTAKEIFTF